LKKNIKNKEKRRFLHDKKKQYVRQNTQSTGSSQTEKNTEQQRKIEERRKIGNGEIYGA